MVALRILMLLAVAAAVAAAAVIGWRDPTRSEPGARYVCPMHAEVSAAAPGTCPICHMALSPVRQAGAAARPAAALRVDQNLDNLWRHKVIDIVHRRTLLFDARERRGPAWAEPGQVVVAVLYDDQVASLAADEPGSFAPTRDPAARIAVRRTAEPPARWDRSTSLVRFRVEGAARAAPGQVGWLELARKPRDVLAVPSSAILESPEGPYVLRVGDGYHLERRSIEVGETFLGLGIAVVLSGLREHDRVVSRAAFFLDAEQRENGLAAPIEVTP
jgi:hypothetical protein